MRSGLTTTRRPLSSRARSTGVDVAATQVDNVDRVDETIASRRTIDDATAGRLARAAATAADLATQVSQFAAGEQAADDDRPDRPAAEEPDDVLLDAHRNTT